MLFVQEGSSTTTAVSGTSTSSSALWSRSVGTMKFQLSGLVRPKAMPQSTLSSSSNDCAVAACVENVAQSNNGDTKLDGTSNSNSVVSRVLGSSEQKSTGSKAVSVGLAGLGAYSSSSSGSSGSGDDSN